MKPEWPPFAWVFRPGLGRRIALAMLLSLAAIQIQAFVQVWTLADPEVRFVGARWLAKQVAGASDDIFAQPRELRPKALAARSTSQALLRLTWTAHKPVRRGDEPGGLLMARLSATLRDELGPRVRSLEVTRGRLEYLFPISSVRTEIASGTLDGSPEERAIDPGDAEALIPGNVRIAIEGPDLTWLTAEIVGFADAGPLGLPLLPLIVGGLIIAAFSIGISRRIVAPLDRLVDAANRIGAARAFVPVPPQDLGEFAAVAHAFEDMQRRLLGHVDDRTRMLAAISHDLRSALMRLRISSEAADHSALRTEMQAEIDEMRAMIDSTLAFASGEANQSPSRPVDVAALLISLSDDACDMGRLCEYHGPDHAETAGHPGALKRAFWNLIDNALKYGARAEIDLRIAESAMIVSIRDFGPGIPPEREEEAFAPFRRLDPSRSPALPGVGLGLTIARDVIQAHGGDVRTGRADDRRFEVIVTLPRSVSGICRIATASHPASANIRSAEGDLPIRRERYCGQVL